MKINLTPKEALAFVIKGLENGNIEAVNK